MDQKTLDKHLYYLDIVQTTYDHDGWGGGYEEGVHKSSVTTARKFFDFLTNTIPIKEIPKIDRIAPSEIGGISIFWETEIDPNYLQFDSFEVILCKNDRVICKSCLESLGTKEEKSFDSIPELNYIIIEHMNFFKRKQDEQRKIQESSTS